MKIEKKEMVDVACEWEHIEKEIALLNKLINEAAEHGSDGQGWYFTNKERLDEAIKSYLDYTGLNYVSKLYWNEDEIPLIVVTDCKCDGCLRNYLEKK